MQVLDPRQTTPTDAAHALPSRIVLAEGITRRGVFNHYDLSVPSAAAAFEVAQAEHQRKNKQFRKTAIIATAAFVTAGAAAAYAAPAAAASGASGAGASGSYGGMALAGGSGSVGATVVPAGTGLAGSAGGAVAGAGGTWTAGSVVAGAKSVATLAGSVAGLAGTLKAARAADRKPAGSPALSAPFDPLTPGAVAPGAVAPGAGKNVLLLVLAALAVAAFSK